MPSLLHLSAAEFQRTVLDLHPQTAVFDCDGTLWSGDAGYQFMLWSIETGLVSRSASDWMHARYRLYQAGTLSELAICGEMVQLYTGLAESELRHAARIFVDKYVRSQVIPEMRSLLASLRAAGSQIWAVSSTNNWVIEEGVRLFEIPPERVLCARVAVADGRITSDLLDVPTDAGKAISLERVGLPRPDAVFGNSIHDAAMLSIAGHPFAVNPTPALLEMAEERSWPVFRPELRQPA